MTTGRINQVAILRDVTSPAVRRGVTGRARPSCRRSKASHRTRWGDPATSTACTGSESLARTRGPHARSRTDGTRGLLRRPPRPLARRRKDAHAKEGPIPMERVAHTRTTTGQTKAHLRLTQGEEDRPSTVRWRSTEPADGDDQTTTHTPARSCFPTPPYQPHPARPWPSEQMEETGGVGPTTLGMVTGPTPW